MTPLFESLPSRQGGPNTKCADTLLRDSVTYKFLYRNFTRPRLGNPSTGSGASRLRLSNPDREPCNHIKTNDLRWFLYGYDPIGIRTRV